MQPAEDREGHEEAFVSSGLGFSESGIRIWDLRDPLILSVQGIEIVDENNSRKSEFWSLVMRFGLHGKAHQYHEAKHQVQNPYQAWHSAALARQGQA